MFRDNGTDLVTAFKRDNRYSLGLYQNFSVRLFKLRLLQLYLQGPVLVTLIHFKVTVEVEGHIEQ